MSKVTIKTLCLISSFLLLTSINVIAADIRTCKANGINLQGVTYWTHDNPFTDMAKLSMNWIRPWGSSYQNIPLDLDQNGYPKSIDAGMAQTIISNDDWGRDLVNDVDYVLLYDGEGQLVLNIAYPKIIQQTPGRIVFKLAQGRLGILEKQTNPNNYIRNIRIVPLSEEKTYLTNKFRASYVSKWGKFPVWRFMNHMDTVNSTAINWKDIKTSASFGATGGMGIDDIIAISNKANISPWINIPHLANDDFVFQLAKYVKANLNPSLKVYIEYSNEVWNTAFKASTYAKQQATALGVDSNQYYAERSLQIFKIWEQVYGDTNGIVRVIGTQFFNPWISERILSWKDLGSHTDALAVGYYFGYELGTPNYVDKTLLMSVDELMISLKNDYIPSTKTYLAKQKAVADKYNLALIAYEAGQHLAAAGSHPTLGYLQNLQALTDKLIAANKHPLMHDLYLQFYSNWIENGGGLISWFISTDSFSKFGSWGLLEYENSSEANFPKYSAVMQIVNSISSANSDPCKTVNTTTSSIPFTGTVLSNGSFTGTLSTGEQITGTININSNNYNSIVNSTMTGSLIKK